LKKFPVFSILQFPKKKNHLSNAGAKTKNMAKKLDHQQVKKKAKKGRRQIGKKDKPV
jgi:hypothetical protein